VPDPPLPAIDLPLVPPIVGLDVSDAVELLRRSGLRASVNGSGQEVVAQQPTAGHLAPRTTRHHPYGGIVTVTAGP
jgi:hypothetical protein